MKMAQVRTIAKGFGLKTGGVKKDDLIRAIQEAEGNFPCFGSAEDYCDQPDCRWREVCLP